MLYELRELAAFSLRGRDGEVGNITDLYVSNGNWVVRYVVADTRHWLAGRKLLISPFAVERIDPESGELRAALTRERISGSQPLERKEQMGRCYEGEFNEFFGYPPYWRAERLWTSRNLPKASAASLRCDAPNAANESSDRLKPAECGLFSANALVTYTAEAIDGDLGRIETLLVDSIDWSVSAAIIDASRAWREARIMIPSRWLDAPDVAGRRVPVRGSSHWFRTLALYEASIAQENRRARLEDICRALLGSRQWRER